MRLSKEALSISVVVRRVAIGAAPFAWEVHRAGNAAPIDVSTDRFRSMEAAYAAGQVRLAALIPKRPSSPVARANRMWAARQAESGGLDALTM